MKKFWRIPNDRSIKQSLEHIKVDPEYIKILLDKECYPQTECLSLGKDIYVSYNNEDYKDNYWGWEKCSDSSYEWYIKRNHKYCGIVSLRKDKLKKINEYGKI